MEVVPLIEVTPLIDVNVASKIVEYHKLFMPALFATGFTIGSFLFSMKSVIIKTLKEDVYDNELYQEETCQRIADGETDSFYENLSNFSNLLMYAIISSFISAISQIAFGFLNVWWASSICLFIAIVSWMFLGMAIYRVHQNWQDSFRFADQKAKKSKKDRIKELKKDPFEK